MRHARRAVFGTTLALFVSLTACGSPPHPRNVVIITLDTMRADRLPAYGFSGIATPALDRLAAEGALFEEAFAAVPLTVPSHATLFTGLYPPRLSVRDNADRPLAPEFQTLAELLHDRGMTTGAFVASAVLAPGRGLAQGFQTYSTASAGACADSPRGRRSADAVVDDVLTWLEAHRSGPFFAWMHLYDAHRPYRLPDNYSRGYPDPYLAAIAFEDAQIARLISHLEARGILDDTLIVVVGDHGESLGDHGEESHGIFVYQETLHVPLLLRGPGIKPRRIAAAVRLVDVMPTVLEIFGFPAPALDGVSLMPLLNGEKENAAREVYAESLYPERFGWASLHALRADRYKVIDAPRPELYDLKTDPYEERNLFGTKPSVAAAMLDRLRSFRREQQGNMPLSVGPALAEGLASLGYVSGTSSQVRTATSSQYDPKDMIADFNDLTRLQSERGAARASACPSGQIH